MALIACRNDGGAATKPRMQGEPWQIRAKAAGLTQRLLARLTDKPENTISRQLRGEFGGEAPGYLIAIIIAWELMDEDRRADWLTAINDARKA